MSVVLDTSAILALLWGEPGAEQVEAAVTAALVSTVNQAELVAKLVDRGANAAQVDEVLAALNLSLVAFDAPQALDSGQLRRSTKAFGLSLGDRACLALARSRGVAAMTADRVWAQLGLDMEIEVIR